MSFDTTASNSGAARGACTLLQQKIGRPLYNFACRHHIFELVAEAAFSTCLGPSSGPDIAIFKRFQSQWNSIDQSKFDPMMDDDLDAAFADVFFGCKEQVISFCIRNLTIVQPRDDYREFLELTIILFGGHPPRGTRFIQPGAFHRARWMARVIYGLKIYMFRKQFHLTAGELKGFRRFVAFSAMLYVKAWFTASSAVAAPASDLAYLKELISFPDPQIAQATSKKFANHLWYLSEDLAGLALFDDSVSMDTKRKMVAALKEESQGDPHTRARVDLTAKDTIATKTVADFVTSASSRIFQAFKLNTEFLDKDPAEWVNDQSFSSSQQVLLAIAVVNDFAERGVALIQDYNKVLTKDEQQRQYLLQVVEWHRRQFHGARKQDILQSAG